MNDNQKWDLLTQAGVEVHNLAQQDTRDVQEAQEEHYNPCSL